MLKGVLEAMFYRWRRHMRIVAKISYSNKKYFKFLVLVYN